MKTYDRYKKAYLILLDLLSDLESCNDSYVVFLVDSAWIDLGKTGLLMDMERACIAVRRKNGAVN